MLALWVHTTGVLACCSPRRSRQSTRAPWRRAGDGANALEEIVYGVISAGVAAVISYSLYRFESNVRSASVVGIVGGRVGTVLWDIICSFRYAETCAVMIIIVAFAS